MPETRDSHGGVPHQVRPVLPALGQAVTAPAFAPIVFEDLPPLAIDADGWLVGPGTRREATGISSGSGWHYGHPIGVLNHFTDGCGDPHDTLVSRGVSAHGCTLGDGTLLQYVPFTRLSWHAYDEAYYDVGWENAAAPGVACDFAPHQLCRLAQLNAAVIAWTKTTFGFEIPAVRAPGGAYSAGLKCHTDGLAPGSPWDPKGHWDAPWRATGDAIAAWVSAGERAALDRSPWSSDDFVAAVAHYSGGDEDMRFDNWHIGFERRLKQGGPPDDSADPDTKLGFADADIIMDGVAAAKAGTKGPAGPPGPAGAPGPAGKDGVVPKGTKFTGVTQ